MKIIPYIRTFVICFLYVQNVMCNTKRIVTILRYVEYIPMYILVYGKYFYYVTITIFKIRDTYANWLNVCVSLLIGEYRRKLENNSRCRHTQSRVTVCHRKLPVFVRSTGHSSFRIRQTEVGFGCYAFAGFGNCTS